MNIWRYKNDELLTTKEKSKQLLSLRQQTLERKVLFINTRSSVHHQQKNSMKKLISNPLVKKYFTAFHVEEKHHNVHCLNEVLKVSKLRRVKVSSFESLKKPRSHVKN